MGNELKLSALCFFIFWELNIIPAQGLKTCGVNENCIRTSRCPPMINLLRTNKPENIKIVREAICQFQGKRELVCCPYISKPAVRIRSPRCGHPATADRVIGGSPAPIGAYPWMAALGYTGLQNSAVKFLCSGSLISSRYVLTAAHCVDSTELRDQKLSFINLGDWDITTERDCEHVSNGGEKCAPRHITAGIESITVHPDYGKRAISSDDIALIRLNYSIDFNTEKAHVEPVCLPEPSFNIKYAKENKLEGIAAGWGFTEKGSNSNILLRVAIPFADESHCRRRYGTQFLSKQLCVGGRGGADTCTGDSGGPLVMSGKFGPPYYQVGIVSYGSFPCGLQAIPGVYTSVNDYRDWINQNIKP